MIQMKCFPEIYGIFMHRHTLTARFDWDIADDFAPLTMKVLQVEFQGRLGNQLITYAWARALAERYGAELQTEAWIGQTLFSEVYINPIRGPHDLYITHDLFIEPRWDTRAIKRHDVVLANYILTFIKRGKLLMNFTRAQARRWFTFRPEFTYHSPYERAYHRRYFNPNTDRHFANISLNSYKRAMEKAGYSIDDFEEVSERVPHKVLAMPKGLQLNLKTEGNGCDDVVEKDCGLYTDFQILTQAKVLFRANSSYSFMAGVLGHGKVYSPQVKGVPGGWEEQDAEFERGNHCSFWPGGLIGIIEPPSLSLWARTSQKTP
jgi:hypothetical protein